MQARLEVEPTMTLMKTRKTSRRWLASVLFPRLVNTWVHSLFPMRTPQKRGPSTKWMSSSRCQITTPTFIRIVTMLPVEILKCRRCMQGTWNDIWSRRSNYTSASPWKVRLWLLTCLRPNIPASIQWLLSHFYVAAYDSEEEGKVLLH